MFVADGRRFRLWLRRFLADERLAYALILDDAQDFSAADWDGSSERRRIARWHRAALAMRDGGYQELLGAA